MKYKPYIWLFFAVCLLLYMVFETIKSQGVIETRIKEIKNVCKEGIEEMHIIAEKDDGITCYIQITNKTILKEFNKSIQEDTYSPSLHSGQFNYDNIITLITLKRFYTIGLYYGSYSRSLQKDSVNIDFTSDTNFNVVPLFYKYNGTGFLGSVYEKYGQPNSLSQLRNHKLYPFMKTYVYDIMKNGQNIDGVKLITCRDIQI